MTHVFSPTVAVTMPSASVSVATVGAGGCHGAGGAGCHGAGGAGCHGAGGVGCHGAGGVGCHGAGCPGAAGCWGSVGIHVGWGAHGTWRAVGTMDADAEAARARNATTAMVTFILRGEREGGRKRRFSG